MGTLHMIFDTVADEDYTPGQYGKGLASAFGHNHGLLRNMPRVTQLQRVKFSIGGGFQFDMNMLQGDTPVLCDYLQMAAAIMKHYKLDPFQVRMLACRFSTGLCLSRIVDKYNQSRQS